MAAGRAACTAAWITGNVSNSGVWRILRRLELNRLPASQRHQRHDRRWKR